jgi:hypothetical protein
LNETIVSYSNDLINQTQSLAKSADLTPSRLDQKVGGSFHALISTSVVVNNPEHLVPIQNPQTGSEQMMTSVDALNFRKAEYDAKNSEHLQNEEYLKSLEHLPIHVDDIKFGYWGRVSDLTHDVEFINSHHEDPEFKDIVNSDKTSRFLPLGSETWRAVLSLSPAEPGLSSMLPFSSAGNNYISLGGWSDLLPIPALKFMGCKNVVYVTRQGGESLFAQGVAKRIFHFDEIDWKDLDPSDSVTGNKTQFYNNMGRTEETQDIRSGRWTKMFNLANPQSSFNLSLRQADAVICTQWNSFDIKKDFKNMILEAYKAPIYNPSNLDFLGLKAHNKIITDQDNTLAPNIVRGFQVPQFAGCIPTVFDKALFQQNLIMRVRR